MENPAMWLVVAIESEMASPVLVPVSQFDEDLDMIISLDAIPSNRIDVGDDIG